MACARTPLLPRMKASPNLFFSCPLTYFLYRGIFSLFSAIATQQQQLHALCRWQTTCLSGLHRNVHVAVQARQDPCMRGINLLKLIIGFQVKYKQRCVGVARKYRSHLCSPRQSSASQPQVCP